jgi:hypothetical protein
MTRAGRGRVTGPVLRRAIMNVNDPRSMLFVIQDDRIPPMSIVKPESPGLPLRGFLFGG